VCSPKEKRFEIQGGSQEMAVANGTTI